MKCVVLDLEFTELVPDDNLEESSLRIACAATLLSDCQEPLLWKPQDHESFLNPGVLTHLISQLMTMTQMGQQLVTWGGMSSDFRMLVKECPFLKDSIQLLARSSLDIPFVSACTQGMMMSLASVAQACGFQDKVEGSSKDVPSLWLTNRAAVQNHVSVDVLLTMKVYRNILQTGILQWKTQKGFIRKSKFVSQTIEQCIAMESPKVPYEIRPCMDPKVMKQWLQN